MSMLDKLVAHDPTKPFINAREFAERTQVLFDKVYPLPCTACGRREEERRPVTLSDGKTVIVGAYCACGAYKGPVPASPMEAYRALQTVHALPRGSREALAACDTAAIGDVVSGVLAGRDPLPPERRFKFMSIAAEMGATELRIRADLAALAGETLESCSYEGAQTVLRALRAEQRGEAA